MNAARRTLAAGDRGDAVPAVLAAIGKSFAAAGTDLAAAYDTIVRQTPAAHGVSFESIDTGAIRGEWCRPQDAPGSRAIVFFHGGGYVYGTAHAYRGFASQIAARTGTAAFASDYRRPPAHPFPAAFEDAVATRAWLAASGVREAVLAGDSAGGGLALALLAVPQTEASLSIVGCVAMSPWTDLSLATAGGADPAIADPVIRRDGLRLWASSYLAGADARDPRASPLFGRPHALPATYLQVGENELLCDDTLRYAELAERCGGNVRVDVWEGLFHVFQRRVTELESARIALDDVATFINGCWTR